MLEDLRVFVFDLRVVVGLVFRNVIVRLLILLEKLVGLLCQVVLDAVRRYLKSVLCGPN